MCTLVCMCLYLCVCLYLCMRVQMCLDGNAFSFRSWTWGSLEDLEKEARMLVY